MTINVEHSYYTKTHATEMMKETKIPSNTHAMFLLDLKPPRVGYNIASCHNTIINTELISESRAKVEGSKETQGQMSQTSGYTLSLRTHAQIAKKPPDKRSCGHSPPRLMLLLETACQPATGNMVLHPVASEVICGGQSCFI